MGRKLWKIISPLSLNLEASLTKDFLIYPFIHRYYLFLGKQITGMSDVIETQFATIDFTVIELNQS